LTRSKRGRIFVIAAIKREIDVNNNKGIERAQEMELIRQIKIRLPKIFMDSRGQRLCELES